MLRISNRIHSVAILLTCVAALSMTSAPVRAQRGGGPGADVSNGPFGSLRWRSIGPARGGRSIAVAGSVARLF